MKKLRISILINQNIYPDRIGGAEIFAHRLSLELSKRGYEIHVIAWKSRKTKSNINNKIFYHWVARNSLVFSIRGFFELLKTRPNIVLAIMLQSCLPGLLYSRISRKPLIIRFSGGDLNYAYKARVLRKCGICGINIVYLLLALAAKHANFIVLSKDNYRKLRSLGVNKDKISIIPNFIDEQFFKITPKIESNNIVFVGRIHPNKGVDTLIKAFSHLSKKFPNLRLIIVGNGVDRKKIENLINDLHLNHAIKIEGFVAYESIPKYLSKAGIFVLPSRTEPLSNALLQAIAAGLPIVASNVEGIPDIITHEKQGLLVPPDNPKRLAAAIEELIVNKTEAKKLSKNAKRRAERFRLNNIVSRYEELFYKLLKN